MVSMLRPERRFRESIEEYLNWCERRGLAGVTIKDYRECILRCYKRLQDGLRTTQVSRIAEEEINHLRAHIKGDPPYIKAEVSMFGTFLRYHGNDVVRKMAIRWPHVTRPNVEWHSEDELQTLIMEAQGREQMVIHLGLDLCMRRIEMMRAMFEHFDMERGSIQIIGKGQGGGKIRLIPLHPLTPTFLGLLKEINGREIGPLFPRLKPKGSQKPLSKNAMDLILDKLSARVGFKTSFHRLRRSGARNMWKAGIPVETIAKILGHSSTETTLRYIGVDMSDMAKAFQTMCTNRVTSAMKLPTRK